MYAEMNANPSKRNNGRKSESCERVNLRDLTMIIRISIYFCVFRNYFNNSNLQFASRTYFLFIKSECRELKNIFTTKQWSVI